MHSLRFASAALLVAVASASAWAADIRVPQDHRNVKDALIAAQPGDRVIVSGGRWRNGRVLKPDVTLSGRMGATLSGDWEIGGPRATVEGFIVHDGQLTVTGDDVTLRGNRFVGRRHDDQVDAEQVAGLIFEDNLCLGVLIRMPGGTNQVVRGNRLFRAGIYVSGGGTVVEDNVLRANAGLNIGIGATPLVRRNVGGSIYVSADNAVVEDNSPNSIGVLGDAALIAHNEIVSGWSIQVEGDDAVVRDNRVHCVHSYGGIGVRGARAVVTDNVVDNLDSRRVRTDYSALVSVVEGASSQVLRNQVSHFRLGGIVVASAGAEVAWNTLNGTAASPSMQLEADGIDAHDNTIVRKAEVGDQWNGVVVNGDGNSVTDTSVSGAPYDGVRVEGAGNVLTRVHVGRAGRCGITVVETSSGTDLIDCQVDRAQWASLFVLGSDTTITGGSFTGGRKVDVLDLGTGTQIDSATFETKSEDAALAPYR